MKKLLALILSCALVLSLAACGGSSAPTQAADSAKPAESAKTTEAAKPAEEKAPSGTVTVYVAHNADQYNTVIQEFQELYDIEVLAVSLGGGDALQRVAAEAANPQCDVVWGPTTDSLEAYKDYFQPFVSSEADAIPQALNDPDHLWTAESQQPSVLMYNKDLVSEEDVPKTWEDLLDPKWEGKIASANPGSSSSAYTILCTAIMSTSKDKNYDEGWSYVEKLAKNIIISGGSSSVYKGVADGEYPLGLTLEQLAYVEVSADPEKTGMVYLENGSSNAPDGFAMVKDCPDPENAEIFMNFLLSKECQQIMSDEFGRRTVRNDVDQPSGLPTLEEIGCIDYDFAWAGNKADVVARWDEIAVNVISAS